MCGGGAIKGPRRRWLAMPSPGLSGATKDLFGQVSQKGKPIAEIHWRLPRDHSGTKRSLNHNAST
jgi:hypothetical protein